MDASELIPILDKLINGLEKLTDQRGVPSAEKEHARKNIINTDIGELKEKSNTLSSDEKGKATDLFTLFSQIYTDYKKKQKIDEKPTTLIGNMNKNASTAKESSSANLKEEKGGLINSIMKLLIPAALGFAAVIGGVASVIMGFFKSGPMGDVMVAIGKVGIIGGLKLIARSFLKKLAMPLLRRLPFIGGIISFFDAYTEFSAGNIGKGLLKLVSGFANFVPVVGPFLSIGVDLLTAFLDSKGTFSEDGALGNKNIMGTIKGWGASIGKFVMDNAINMPILGTVKRMGMAYDAFTSGKWGEGFKQLGIGIISVGGGGGFMENGINYIMSFFDGEPVRDESGKIKTGGFKATIKGWINSMGSWISEHALNLPIIGMTTRMGMAYEAFSSSKWGEGFKQLGIGLLSILGGGEYIQKGVEYMWSLFDGEPVKDESGAIQTGGFTATIKGWINSIGAWISERADRLPIIGGIKRFGNVYNAFSSGDWSGGLKELSLALATFVGGGPLADGVNMLLDMASGTTETPIIGKKISWIDGVKNFIKDKLKVLPYWIRKGLSFLGFDTGSTDEDDNTQTQQPSAFGSMLGMAGKAIGSVFSSDEQPQPAPPQPAPEIPKVESALSSQFERMLVLEKTQVQLLTTLVNIGESTYKLWSKMGNNMGGGSSSSPVMVNVPTNSGTTPSSTIAFYDNRSDYATSPYTLA
jgi:hypothetical protein